MTEQGDGAHAQPNEEQPLLAEGGNWGDMDNFFENGVEHVIMFAPHIFEVARLWEPEQLDNNDGDHINQNNFFNMHFEIDDSNSDDGNDDNNADDENDHNNRDTENDHSYCNYNFADDDQNADSSNDEEECNEAHQDENELAAAEVDYEVNPDEGEAEEDLLPGGFRRQFREEDSDDEKSHASEQFHWWDEFADSASEEQDSLLEGDKESDEGDEDEGDEDER
ncbi:prostatic spermine-binding protein-like [Neolamprologus brichardi]|uniref:prostatic spermine-binding protein-like n=1 Tax=Neolamprologus brichardi TaxID=32507 RepID=UPI0003EC3223|nr:prostatic spermine-binding protein-like [Neolamprologus brichardi]XP_006797162.1 prostatic spermine-binding protein-like [Neolamprologus brichardi]